MNEPFIVDDLQLITGIDIAIEPLGITIQQPTLKQIAMIGEQNYFIALELFTISKKSMKIDSTEITNWDVFKEAIKQKIPGIVDNRVLITNFLRLFFKKTVNLGPNSIIVMDDNVVNIEGDDFSILQSVIGKVGGKSLLNDTDSNNEFNTKSKAASRIAEKMKKARERLAKVKAQEAGSAQPENGKGFLYKYIKVVATKTANSLDQVTDMTLYQINTLMKAYLAWEAYDIDVRSRLSMFSSGNKKELVHWSDESQANSK